MALTYKEDGRPSFQFYPDDWIAETGLRLCSLNAKGLWIEMLCIMFYNKPRGLLIANGLQIDNKMLAKILGEKEESIASSVQELEGYKVFSRLPDSTIYSRRMYNQSLQEAYLKEIRSEAGKKGMEKRWKKGDNKKITEITASTSTPTSSSKKKKEEEKENIPQQSKALLTSFPKNVQFLIKDYVELARLENKTKIITVGRELRLITEIFDLYKVSDPERFYKALKTTCDKSAPHINYIKAVLKRLNKDQEKEVEKRKQHQERIEKEIKAAAEKQKEMETDAVPPPPEAVKALKRIGIKIGERRK